jgi:hypothetical protein
LKAIETTEAWAKGEGNITLEDVRKAARAAYAADVAAYAAAYAAVHVAYAVNAAADVADAAYAAADVARLKTFAKCADIARQYYPVAPKLKRK